MGSARIRLPMAEPYDSSSISNSGATRTAYVYSRGLASIRRPLPVPGSFLYMRGSRLTVLLEMLGFFM